jgi:glycosyltransferase involved in cell wall biosynthesis
VRVSKIDIIPIYTDVKAIESAPVTTDLKRTYPQFDHIVLMASRLTYEKDIPTALRAFKMHVASHPKTGLLIVGTGSESEKIDRLAKRLGIEKSVVCEEWVESQTLYSYYKTADMFLSTSLFEGYGLTLLEAALARTPIVSTDVGIAPELLKGALSVQLCPPKDAVCIARALDHVAENFDKAKMEAAHVRNELSVRGKGQYMREYKNSLWMCTE